LPVFEKVVEDGIEFLFRRVPRLVEVVVNARGVNGPDGGLSIGVGGKQNPARLRISRPGTLKKLDSRHSRHALVADDQCDRLVTFAELIEGVEGRLAAGGAQDTVAGAVFAAQVLDHRFKNANVVINRKEDRPGHIPQFKGSGHLKPEWPATQGKYGSGRQNGRRTRFCLSAGPLI